MFAKRYSLKLGVLFITVILLAGCTNTPKKDEILGQMVSKIEGQYVLHIFSRDMALIREVQRVQLSHSKLLDRTTQVAIHRKAQMEWLEILEETDNIFIVDQEKIVFRTSDPEELLLFAETL
ncbi:hypothetical protein [Paenibacillus daejeonensis]|uniref:hypothetical protein n=1 Tax=Paenibacillus daejeonensis TaxID=135193 RepID=UPI00037C2BA0|nr:hypothetical protein [Paenibacillus daejeonensis]